MTQYADQVLVNKFNLTKNKGISRVFQKMPRDFNDTVIYTPTVPSSPVLFVVLGLTLNDLESIRLSSGSSLQYCHKISDILSNYCYVLLSYTLALQHQDLCCCLLLCYFFNIAICCC